MGRLDFIDSIVSLKVLTPVQFKRLGRKYSFAAVHVGILYDQLYSPSSVADKCN